MFGLGYPGKDLLSKDTEEACLCVQRAAYLNRSREEKGTEHPTGPRFSSKEEFKWVYTSATEALGGKGRGIKSSRLPGVGGAVL